MGRSLCWYSKHYSWMTSQCDVCNAWGEGGGGEYDENFRHLSQIHISVRTIKGVGPFVMLMK